MSSNWEFMANRVSWCEASVINFMTKQDFFKLGNMALMNSFLEFNRQSSIKSPRHSDHLKHLFEFNICLCI